MAKSMTRARDDARARILKNERRDRLAWLEAAMDARPRSPEADPVEVAAWMAEMWIRFGDDFDRAWSAGLMGLLSARSDEDMKRAVRENDLLLSLAGIGSIRAMPVSKTALTAWIAAEVKKRGGAWDNGRCRYTSPDGIQLKVSMAL